MPSVKTDIIDYGMMIYRDMLADGTADGVPCFLRDFTLGMDVAGVDTDSVFSENFDSKLSADCICAFQKFTGQDAVIGCTHSPAFIIEQFGGKMRYPKDKIPVPLSHPLSGIRDYGTLDTEFKGKILGAFESYSIVKERMKGKADVVGNITGPLTKAGVLAGVEEITMMMESDADCMNSLLKFCAEFTERIIERLSETADSFIVASATDNPDMFGIGVFREYSARYMRGICRKIHGIGSTVMFHPHGKFVGKEDYSADIMGMDIDCFHFAENNDVSLVSEKFGGRMCVAGGTDIVPTLMSDPGRTESETLRYLNAFEGKQYVFMASCSLHRGVPLENVRRMCETVHGYNNQ